MTAVTALSGGMDVPPICRHDLTRVDMIITAELNWDLLCLRRDGKEKPPADKGRRRVEING